MVKANDLIGQRFGKLTVIKRLENNYHGNTTWLCKCDCGNEIKVLGYRLTTGQTKSCGCLKSKYKGKQKRIRDIIHSRYHNMKQRCYNPNEKAYKNYGGRGITVCEEWKQSFEPFYDWAICNGFKEYLTIDRIDNNKGYSPENCRWITRKEQNNNFRKNRLITYNGETKTMAQWAEILNIKYKIFSSRFASGWSLDRLFNTPYIPRIKNNG